MRVVLTDGPVFLQWLGLIRKEAFSRAEERLLAKLVPSLARRLRDERVLWSGIPVSFGTVELALDLVGMPAFLVDSRGKLVLANEPGIARLEQSPSIGVEVVKAVTASTYGPHVRAVTPIGGPGVARHHVVVLTDAPEGLAGRLRFVELDVGLTTAEARVLGRVVEGDPNKDIATRLGCSTRTVEVHVTAILAKCKVDSRARLIAWFWTR
jgi:DNA-binding CsgD family transcriptional regulator